MATSDACPLLHERTTTAIATQSYATFAAPPTPLHPQQQASWRSKLFLNWVTPLLTLGNRKQLDLQDIWVLQEPLQTQHVHTHFRKEFDTCQSIPRALLRTFWSEFFLTGVCFWLAIVGELVGPIALNRVVTGISQEDTSGGDDHRVLELTLTRWVLVLFVSKVVQAVGTLHGNFTSESVAIQVTAALKSMLYQKAMLLNAESRLTQNAGAIANNYSGDTQAMLSVVFFVHDLWLVPLQVVSIAVLLFSQLGVSAMAGLLVMAASFALSDWIARQLSTFFAEIMKARDARMKQINGVFKGISTIKLNTWEELFSERIDQVRAQELDKVWKSNKLSAASGVVTWALPFCIAIVTFGVYVLVFGHELTPANVFTSLALFQLIQSPLRYFASLLSSVRRARVSAERIKEFMQLPEVDPANVIRSDNPKAQEFKARNVQIAITNGRFGWQRGNVLLRDINLEIQKGELVVVHGKVGGGKTSLCSAILGEMIKEQGTVFVGGSIAYCSQQPWIQNMTIRENILFGRRFDANKYAAVLEACELVQDLQDLQAGDATEVGARGVNLSGGQKARLALARACYSNADVFVLDSPLAAVDVLVQNEIFHKCMLGLLRHKTVLLVTHTPEIIESKYVNRVICMDAVDGLTVTKVNKDVGLDDDGSMLRMDPLPDCEDEPLEVFAQESVTLEPASAGEACSGQLVQEEQRPEGRVRFAIFRGYFDAAGGWTTVVQIVVAQGLWQVFQILSDFWLGHWSTEGLETTQSSKPHPVWNLTVYSALGLGASLMVFVRSLVVAKSGLQAAKCLFDKMTYSLLHAPMRFFDVNPLGRILNRYSEDVATVDRAVPNYVGAFLERLFSMGCTLATAAVVIRWYGVLLLPVMYIYFMIGAFYLFPAREIDRLQRVSKSPQLSHLSESLDGALIIRAFGKQEMTRFRLRNDLRLDTNHRVWFADMCITQWFAFRIELLATLVVLLITYSLLVLRAYLSVGVIAVAFTYSLKVSENMSRIVQVWSRVETGMVSPERLQEYIDIPQEAARTNAMADPPARAWPSHGEICFKDVDFRYGDGEPLVLKKTTFSVRACERIGIVGRTGAGKSSLTMALFRVNELASGSIIIDGVDISTIGLKTLREKISIIPQLPVFFKGTLRSYLDPFHAHSEEKIWQCIKHAGVYERIAATAGKLDCEVEENGDNFSVGERQMICIARALLSDARIVVFDEATAAIDHETDQKLQQVIQQAFANATVLTIAHRLETILHADRVLVMEAGQVVEFDAPNTLIAGEEGMFFEFLKEGKLVES